MSDTDDEFRVRLGRIGNRHGRKAVGYVNRVRKFAAKADVGRARRTSIFTGSRTGKGVGLVLPTLLSWTSSAVVHDIKGENWHLTAGWRSRF